MKNIPETWDTRPSGKGSIKVMLAHSKSRYLPTCPVHIISYYNTHAQIIINARTTTGFKFSKIPETPAVTGAVMVEIVLCLTHLYKLLYFCFSNYGLLKTDFPCFYYKYFCQGLFNTTALFKKKIALLSTLHLNPLQLRTHTSLEQSPPSTHPPTSGDQVVVL